jgi:hypothetical protein
MAAQRTAQWTIAAGPAYLSAPSDPWITGGAGAGGIFRTDVQLWGNGRFTAGIGGHALFLGDGLSTQTVCAQAPGASCPPQIAPHISSFFGAGIAVRYDPSRSGGWRVYGRGFAEPIVGVIKQSAFAGPNWTFAASYVGAAVGIAHGPFRGELEAGLPINVRGDYPQIFSLQFGFAP